MMDAASAEHETLGSFVTAVAALNELSEYSDNSFYAQDFFIRIFLVLASDYLLLSQKDADKNYLIRNFALIFSLLFFHSFSIFCGSVFVARLITSRFCSFEANA